jgi:hypothetical protein
VRTYLRTLGSRLFRRRVVWVPTLWGALLLLGLGVATAAAFASSIDGWLAPSAPAVGADRRGARTLVIEGWLEPEELDQALQAFERGRYDRVVTTGGPILNWWESRAWKTYADRAAAYLQAHGLSGAPVTPVPGPASTQDRTFRMAIAVRTWAARSEIQLDAIDLFSAGTHARRSRMLYQLALGSEVEVGVLAAAPSDYDLNRWWTSSGGVKAVVMESVAVAWTACCFWPPRP